MPVAPPWEVRVLGGRAVGGGLRRGFRWAKGRVIKRRKKAERLGEEKLENLRCAVLIGSWRCVNM